MRMPTHLKQRVGDGEAQGSIAQDIEDARQCPRTRSRMAAGETHQRHEADRRRDVEKTITSNVACEPAKRAARRQRRDR